MATNLERYEPVTLELLSLTLCDRPKGHLPSAGNIYTLLQKLVY